MQTPSSSSSLNIIVTGGIGFLGFHLCSKLLSQGHHVTAIDNLQTASNSNLLFLQKYPNFSFLKHDIINPFPTFLHPHQIYNLACPASPPLYQKNPIHTIKTSFLGTLNCLELAKSSNATLLHASTSEVYGDPTVHPQPESYHGNVNPTGPRACYDEGKRAAETLCFDFLRQFNTQIRIVRIFNTYGPNMHPQDGRVVSNFINQALLNQPITIYGSGNQTRSFCYVDDLIQGIISMMNQSQTPGPINLGNPSEFTMLELAQNVLFLTNSSSKLEFLPLPIDDPKQRQPDISLAKQFLNWQPQTPLTQGLAQTIPYFKSLL